MEIKTNSQPIETTLNNSGSLGALSAREGKAQPTSQAVQQAEKIQSQREGEKPEESLSEQLADIAKKLNEQMDFLDTNVRFGYSDKIGSMYISVTEKSTGREIRQIPSEEAMRLAEYFRDVIGMIFDKEI